jgi:hypothetical protein
LPEQILIGLQFPAAPAQEADHGLALAVAEIHLTITRLLGLSGAGKTMTRRSSQE